MPTLYEAKKQTIGQLLSLTSPPLAVPEWQRSYSWTTSQVDKFWDDLDSFAKRYPDGAMSDREYFLGAVVLVDQDSFMQVLDGQQRLATATVLLSVLAEQVSDFNSDAAAVLVSKYISEYDYALETLSLKLTMNRYDRSFFEREVQRIPRPAEFTPPVPELRSHKLIRSARSFLEKKVSAEYTRLSTEFNPRAAFQWANRYRLILTDHVSVVVVTSTDEDNAADVFETLNDRGIGLSTVDLVRNFVLRKANEQDREEIVELWQDILEIHDDASVELFLRHFWVSRFGDVKRHNLYRTIKKKFEEQGWKSLEFTQNLRDEALVYQDLVSAQDDDVSVRRLLQDIADLNAKVLYPALLSSFVGFANIADRLRVLEALLTLYVRHSVIGHLENSAIENVVFAAATDLRKGRDLDEIVVTKLNGRAPTDEAFVAAFSIAEISRQKTARYVLRELEHHIRATNEMELATPDRVHVEHIYPKTPPQDRRMPQHKAIIDRIGNLTLLDKRLNISIQNAPFEEKLTRAYRASQIEMTKRLDEFATWGIDQIDQRQTTFASQAPRIWPLR